MKRRKRDAKFHRPTDTELLVSYITSRYGRESVKGLTRREKLARWGLEPVGRKHVRRIRKPWSGSLIEVHGEVILA